MTGESPDRAGPAASLAAAYRHLHRDAVRLLLDWQAPTPSQDRLRADYLAHLSAHPDGVAKAGPPAHLTASALVFDSTASRVLLTHHAKAGVWLQLGGHLELTDTSLYAAAVREVREESGIDGVRVLPVIAQLDRHRLVGSFGSCREHLDVRFAALAPAGAQAVLSDESLDLRWWPLESLPGETAAEVRDLASACLPLLKPAARLAIDTP
ncbi:MAG: NUDIX domain-containing protein [Candidatus Phosphoribacter sp.]|nr:NUDIX domain-containing protein [Actinomycetales bacterium]